MKTLGIAISRLKLLFLVLLTTFSAKSEEHYVPHISIGAHAGADASQVTFSPQIQQKWNPGFTIGISARYAEEKLVGVVAELNFTQRGWKEDFETPALSYSRKLSYISMPIMTHIYFGPPRCKCFFNLGPEFSLLLGDSTNANFDYTHPYDAPNWPSDPRAVDQLTMKVKNTFDYGICVGVGCEFWLQPRHSVYLEMRYYYGLGNIFSATKADPFGASRNMTLAATIGYNFRLY